MGEFLEAEVDAEGMAVGEFLRIKVKLDVQEPLMRGIKIQVCPGDREGEEEEEGEDSEEESDEDQGDERMEGLKRKKKKRKWCSFAYEYLPDFWYTCGIIGHMDKECTYKLKRGEVQLYNEDMKVNMLVSLRRLGGEAEKGQWSGGRGGFFARSNSSGGRGSWTRSDSESWRRKEDVQAGDMRKKTGEEKEVKSPLKLPDPRVLMQNSNKKFVFPDGVMVKGDNKKESTGGSGEVKEGGKERTEEDMGEVMQKKGESCPQGIPASSELGGESAGEGTSPKDKKSNGKKSGGGKQAIGKTFKRVNRREKGEMLDKGVQSVVGTKRDLVAMEMETDLGEEIKAKR
ncbi:hypothetical protein ZWY2020_003545 [Hordeum vulgare]|nr:hypothetical protein ZWY2020_003545 [Hordeum vulgare]